MCLGNCLGSCDRYLKCHSAQAVSYNDDDDDDNNNNNNNLKEDKLSSLIR